MTYHETGIEKLSKAQISKLLNGHRVRVKHGSHHKVHLSHEQHKKLHAAHKKGCGITLEFDPYQIHNHQHLREGHSSHAHHAHGGSFMDVAKSVGKVAAREGGKQLLNIGSDFAKKELDKRLGSGVKRSVAKRKGKGIHFNGRKVLHTIQDVAPLAMQLAPLAMGAGHRRKNHHSGYDSEDGHGGALNAAGYGFY